MLKEKPRYIATSVEYSRHMCRSVCTRFAHVVLDDGALHYIIIIIMIAGDCM